MAYEHVGLSKRALVQEQFQPLPSGQVAARVVGLDPLLATADHGLFTELPQMLEP